MVQLNENIVGIDAAIFMHPSTWKASGHVDGFNDPMIDNKDSKKRYRADQLIEDKITRYEKDGKTDKAAQLQNDLDDAINRDDLTRLKSIIEEHNIVCPISGTKNWTDVRQFNLMFATQMGAMADGAEQVYLRPETAQGIFVNFLNVQKTGRMKVPFGIAQIGKAFRNEVIARQFIMRMREFEQMELQFFVRPGTEMEWYEKWKAARLKWHLALGADAAKYRYHDHVKPAHYANAAVDIEYDFPFGFKEVEGIHSRTDFDLKQHQEFSGKKMQYFDPEVNQSYIPYVIETSIGLDRLFLTVMANSLVQEDLSTADKQDSRVVLKFHPAIAPVKAAILPLTKKDGLPEKAREIMAKIKLNYNIQYDEKDSIGKRYRRQDAIGTPFCITVDHQTLEDNTVTIRHRDSMEQERVNISDLEGIIGDFVNLNKLLGQLI
jgi:glycyl-tRNA synthetase